MRVSSGALAVVAMSLVASAQAQRATDSTRSEIESPLAVNSVPHIPFKKSPFTFVRIKYSARDRGQGSLEIWAMDHPAADRNFSEQVEQRLGIATNADGYVLELTDPALAQYPFAYLVEGGYLQLSDEEVATLRRYLLGGGFLMVDDFWGEDDWSHLSAEFRRVLPEYEPVELPIEHEIFHTFYQFDEKPQIPSLAGLMGGDEADRETEYRGLVGNDGRLMVLFCQNADFGDGWESIDRVNPRPRASFARAIQMGINIVVYTLSH